MAEAKAAEPNERAAPSPRRPRRKHVINLCCAQSVHRVVEEVARNLEGLGFRTTVVTGAEARAALLGSRTDSEQPTIHVVCVQGSMQERVLKPLRQALATHGGPNHHLFVAVLDLGVPLAMVGQIRRFAEALERAAPPSTTPGTEPASHRDLEQSPTRSYPQVAQVVERGGTKPPLAPEGEEAGERPTRRSRPRVAKIGPTSKYQAVTASHPVIPPEPGVRKRRRTRSRMSPTAPRRPAAERVLGLPEEQQSRPPLDGRREPSQPPPPPAPGELRRRVVTGPTGQAAPPPPPLSRTPSGIMPASGGKPPEPDRVVARKDPGFRFSPPGVKAAADAGRPAGVAGAKVEPPPDADRTLVDGMLVEVPRTASTLRLEEPPFADGSRGPASKTGGEEDEPVEPTMILTAPRGMAPVQIDEEELEPAVTGRTVVGPPPKPTPAALAELERVQREAAKPPAGTGPVESGPRKTFGYLQRDPKVEAAPASTPAAKPVPSSESSGDFVLTPRSSGIDEPTFESSSTLVQRPRGGEAKPSSESSGTMRPRLGGEGPSGTVVQPAPKPPVDVSESEKTLLRGDGTFENSRDLMQKVEAARRGAATPAAIEKAAAPAAEPADAKQDAFKAGKTSLYSDSAVGPMPTNPAAAAPSGAATPKPAAAAGLSEKSGTAAPPKLAEGGTVVTPRPASPGSDGGTVVTPRPGSPASTNRGDTVVAKPKDAAPPEATPGPTEREPNAPIASNRSGVRKLPPSAVPTERHPQAEAVPSRGSRPRKRVEGSEPSPAKPLDARAGVISSTNEAPGPRTIPPRARAKTGASRYGWLWIMLVLLAAGGGWGAYQAGLFSGSDDTKKAADAGTPPPPEQPTPSDTAPRTSAGDAGAGDAGAADSAQPTVPVPVPTPTAETGDDATTGDAPDATTGEPAAAGTTGKPDEPADGGTPDQPPADGGAPDQPSADGGTPDQPSADGGSPDQPPTTGDAPEPPPTDGPRLSAEEQKLSPAVEQRRIFMMKTLFTTRRQGEETSFAEAWRRCAKLEVDGVSRWRLPHRREMKLVNAVLNLPSGVYWTRTVPPEDKSAAYVLDTNDGSLSLFQKSDPNGDVVCVRERDFPEK